MKANTTQQLWRTEFDKQATPIMFEELILRTTALVHTVESTSPWRETLAPSDRINTAIIKTLEGSYEWDPDRVGLDLHLLNVISSDISNETKRGRRQVERGVEHLSLDDDEQNFDDLEQATSEATRARAGREAQAMASRDWRGEQRLRGDDRG